MGRPLVHQDPSGEAHLDTAHAGEVAADPRSALIAPKPVHRVAITTPTEAGTLLRAVEALEDHPTTGVALRLLPFLFVWPGALRFAQWTDFDFAKAVWTIPPHKTKI